MVEPDRTHHARSRSSSTPRPGCPTAGSRRCSTPSTGRRSAAASAASTSRSTTTSATYVETPREIARLAEAMDPALIGICLDVGHALLRRRRSADPAAELRRPGHAPAPEGCRPRPADAPCSTRRRADGGARVGRLLRPRHRRRARGGVPRRAPCARLRRLDRGRAGAPATAERHARRGDRRCPRQPRLAGRARNLARPAAGPPHAPHGVVVVGAERPHQVDRDRPHLRDDRGHRQAVVDGARVPAELGRGQQRVDGAGLVAGRAQGAAGQARAAGERADGLRPSRAGSPASGRSRGSRRAPGRARCGRRGRRAWPRWRRRRSPPAPATRPARCGPSRRRSRSRSCSSPSGWSSARPRTQRRLRALELVLLERQRDVVEHTGEPANTGSSAASATRSGWRGIAITTSSPTAPPMRASTIRDGTSPPPAARRRPAGSRRRPTG